MTSPDKNEKPTQVRQNKTSQQEREDNPNQEQYIPLKNCFVNLLS